MTGKWLGVVRKYVGLIRIAAGPIIGTVAVWRDMSRGLLVALSTFPSKYFTDLVVSRAEKKILKLSLLTLQLFSFIILHHVLNLALRFE